MTDTPLIKEIDGREAVSLEGLALLLDQDPADVQKEFDLQQAISPGQTFRVPHQWLQQGRRIARRTAAETGTYDFHAALDHLAAAKRGERA